MGLCVCSHPLQEEVSLMMTEQGTCSSLQYLTVRGSNEIPSSELLQCISTTLDIPHPCLVVGGEKIWSVFEEIVLWDLLS